MFFIFSHGFAVGSHFLVCFPYSGQAAHSSCHLALSFLSSRSLTWYCLKTGLFGICVIPLGIFSLFANLQVFLGSPRLKIISAFESFIHSIESFNSLSEFTHRLRAQCRSLSIVIPIFSIFLVFISSSSSLRVANCSVTLLCAMKFIAL